MSVAAKFDIMAASGALALLWIVYVAARQQRISSGWPVDQVGMALSLISVLMFFSNFSGLFPD